MSLQETSLTLKLNSRDIQICQIVEETPLMHIGFFALWKVSYQETPLI